MSNSKSMRFGKTLIVLVMCIALALASLAGLTLLRTVDVAHADPTGKWTDEGNYDTSWYDGHESDAVYTLTTASEFAGFAYLVNEEEIDFSGKTVKLGNDINLDGHYWIPIAKHDGVWFAGTFDGQEYTINNMTVDTSVAYSVYAGLFGYAYGATIKNLNLASTCLVNAISNITGSIVGSLENSTLENVTNEGEVIGDSFAGGIVGMSTDSTIINAQNTGSVTSYSSAGGIVYCSDSTTIINSRNSGAISAPYAGGIISEESEGTTHIINSINTGTIDNIYAASMGGLVGGAYYGASVEIINSYNVGSVNGECVGGLVGEIDDESNVTLYNSYNVGDLDGECVGGLIGYADGPVMVAAVSYYLNDVSSAVGDGSCTGTVTSMFESDMKGALNDSSSLAYKLNEYVNNIHTYMGYELRGWDVSDGGYPTFTDNAPLSMYDCWTDEGVYDISWYVGHEWDSEYTLTTAEQLAGLAVIVKGDKKFWSQTIKLGNDIDMSGTEYNANGLIWEPVGASSEHHFAGGTFDGCGYTIRNMEVNTDADYAGLFGYVSMATIKNITIDSSCSVTSIVYYVGGIVGYAQYAAIEGVTNNGSVDGCAFVGGIVGIADSCEPIENATNGGRVSGMQYVGGIVGQTNSRVTGAINSGTTEGQGYVGGIAGGLMNNYVTDSINNGEIRGTDNVGGIVGTVSGGVSVESVTNGGSVTGTLNSVGGIIGSVFFASNINMYNSCNTARISGANSVGGIIGNVQNGNATARIYNSYNAGVIVATASGLGGILGTVSDGGWATADNCYNVGAITGSGDKGGIAGCSTNYGVTANGCYYLTTTAAYGIGNTSSDAGCTPCSDLKMRGAAGSSENIVDALNGYVANFSPYWIGGVEYVLKTWSVVNNSYPRFVNSKPTLVIGGDIINGTLSVKYMDNGADIPYETAEGVKVYSLDIGRTVLITAIPDTGCELSSMSYTKGDGETESHHIMIPFEDNSGTMYVEEEFIGVYKLYVAFTIPDASNPTVVINQEVWYGDVTKGDKTYQNCAQISVKVQLPKTNDEVIFYDNMKLKLILTRDQVWAEGKKKEYVFDLSREDFDDAGINIVRVGLKRGDLDGRDGVTADGYIVNVDFIYDLNSDTNTVSAPQAVKFACGKQYIEFQQDSSPLETLEVEKFDFENPTVVNLNDKITINGIRHDAIKWTSSDANAASVDANGHVTVHEQGKEVTITAHAGGRSAVITLKSMGISFTEAGDDEPLESVTLAVGNSIMLTPSFINGNGYTLTSYAYTVEDHLIATATDVGSGNVTITAQTSGRTYVIVTAGIRKDGQTKSIVCKLLIDVE